MTKETVSSIESKVLLELTLPQAKAALRAFDVMSRLGIGQLEVVADLLNEGLVPMASEGNKERVLVPQSRVDDVGDLLQQAKKVLGHPRGGSSGIGHKHVDPLFQRTYEIYKVLAKVVAEHENPTSNRHTTDREGLIVRYTQDTPPSAKVI